MDHIRAADVNFLRAYERVVKYVVEQPSGVRNGKPCARLIFYQALAAVVDKATKAADQEARRAGYGEGRGLNDNIEYRIKLTRNLIRDQDSGMLAVLGPMRLISRHDDVCEIFARMVVGHENDHDVSSLVAHLESWNLVEEGTASRCTRP